MRAEILTIGDELCRGDIVDTNSARLAELLWELEITTRWMTSCNDDRDDIASALTQAVARADLVVCSGALGPTEDGLMVDVVARLAGVAVPSVSARQLGQVRVPSGARVYPNPAGVAPGFEVPIRGVPVVCLPDVPSELHALLEASLKQRFAELREAAGSSIAGPDGGTPDQPVGTVWLALASAAGVTTKQLGWPGARDQLRTLASW